MRSAQFYAIAIFVVDRLAPIGGGAEVMGQPTSLLVRLPHHLSTIAP